MAAPGAEALPVPAARRAPWRGSGNWLRLLGIALWVALLSAVSLYFSRSPWTADDVARSGGMLLDVASWSTDGQAARDVKLPHVFGRSADGRGEVSIGHYRVAFTLDEAQAARPRLGICIPRWSQTGEIHLDGRRLNAAPEGVEAMKDWVRPRHVVLPHGLEPGRHRLDITVRSTPAFEGGLSRLWLGDDAVVGPACQDFTERKREVPIGLTTALMVTGAMALIVAVRLRDGAARCFAATALAWTVHNQFLMSWSLPLSDEAWSLGWMLTRPAFVPPLLLFCLRFAGLQRPALERAVGWTVAAGVAALLLLPWERWWQWIAVVALLSVVLVALLLVLVLPHALRRRELAADMLVASLVFLCFTHLMDLARWMRWISHDFISLSYVSVPMVMGTFAMAMIERLLALYQREQSAARRLEAEVAAQRRELQASYGELRRQRDAVVEAQERQRIMRELHDGIGSHLVAAATLLGAPQPRPAEAAELVERSLHELRNALDALASDASDVAELLGALRDRVEPVLEARGIALDWQVEPLPATRALSATERLHVLRIVQEAFTNILKHAQARQVVLRAAEAESGRSAIAILDDGRGLAGSRPAGGRGLASMRTRAQRLGAELVIEERQQGLRVELRLPAPAAR